MTSQKASVDKETDAMADDDPERSGCSLCNPKKALHRYFFLIFLCFLVFGGYFCYDTPGALQDQITSDMQVSVARFASLYSVYSWPNIVLCFFGGFVVDRILGLRWGVVISSFAVLAGQLLVSLGAVINTFWVMEVGRFIFGVGLEVVIICQNVFAPKWFQERELNAVFGLQVSIARVGSTLNFILNPIVYHWIRSSYEGYTALGVSLFVVSSTCALSQVCAHVVSFLDYRADGILKRGSEASETCHKIRIRDIKNFPVSFWLLNIICFCFYSVVIPFVGLGKLLFTRKYGMTDITGWNSASTVDSTIYLMSIFTSPLFGVIMARIGYNSLWVLISTLLTFLCLSMLCFTFINPWIPMVLLGLGYSMLASSLWPMVALEVPAHKLATAYGLMQSSMNLGLAVFPLVAGVLVDHGGYIFLQIFFIDCISIGTIAAFLLFMETTYGRSKSYCMTKEASGSMPLPKALPIPLSHGNELKLFKTS